MSSSGENTKKKAEEKDEKLEQSKNGILLTERVSRKREPGNNDDDDNDDDNNNNDNDNNEDGIHSTEQSDHEQYHSNSQRQTNYHQSSNNENIHRNSRRRGNRRKNQQRYNYQQYENNEPEMKQQNISSSKRYSNEFQYKSFEETAVFLLDPVNSNQNQFVKEAYGHNTTPNHQPKVEFDRSSLVSPSIQRSITNDILVPNQLEDWIISEQGEAFNAKVQQKYRIDVIQVVKLTYGNKNSIQIRATCANESIFNRARNEIENHFSMLLSEYDTDRNRNTQNKQFHQQINQYQGQPSNYHQQRDEGNYQVSKPNRNFNHQQKPKQRTTLRDIRRSTTYDEPNY